MIIKSIEEYMLKCPFLKDGRFHVNYLGVDAINYTIDTVPTQSTIKRYADGGVLKQYNFIFASRETYGADRIKSIESSGFYEALESWFEEKTLQNDLPILTKERTPQLIETLSSGFISQADEKTARYEIQCRLVYYENKWRL